MSSTTKDKSMKLKARLARGFLDRGPDEIAATERMLAAIRDTYERYGFEALETPFIEYTDVLGKFLPDLDRPNEGVFSFKDDDEQWLSLRYDLTAPLARHVAENFDRLPKPYRSYRAGFVFRNEKPGPGRYRQFMQFDADTVGAASVAADAEMCMLAADTLEHLGIKRGDYVIKVNNRKVLDGVMESIGLDGVDKAGQRLVVLRALDKTDRLGFEAVRQLLGPGRRDDSGDFTKGANLSNDQIHELMTFIGSTSDVAENAKDLSDLELLDSIFVGGSVEVDEKSRGTAFGVRTFSEPGPGRLPITNEATIKKLRGHFSGSEKITEGLDELERISRLARASNYGSRRIRIDPSVVRGLEYYTGPVYEAELTFEIKGEDEKPVRFGSIGGGGRYDGLVGRFRDKDVPATGFSIGVSRLLAALIAVKSPLVVGQEGLPLVVVTVMDHEYLADYQRIVGELRALKGPGGKPLVRAEMYLGEGRFGAQMKYADRRGAICAIIQGSDEKTKGEITVKDLVLGAELAALGRDRDDYRQKQAEAQFSVPHDQLADAVWNVLARHAKL